MKRKKRIWGALMIAVALVIMQLPVSEADASASASDFTIQESGLAHVTGRDAFEEDFIIEEVMIRAASSAPENSAADDGNVLGTTHVVGNRAVFIVDSKQFTVYGGDQGPEDEEVPIVDAVEYDWDGGVPKYAIVDNAIVADQAYYQKQDIGSVALPEGIREIGQFAYARSSLGEIVLPQGVETIGYGAFYHCDSLERVTLPETVMCVEPKAFSHSLWVENFLKGVESDGAVGDFLVEGGVLVAYRGNSADVVVPEGVRVIAGEAFWGHSEIKSVSLPDSLSVIGEGAFEACGSLEQVVFGGNVARIKDRAFLGTKLGEVSLPDSVKMLGLRAFGDAGLSYEGEEPEHVWEASAARLSNGAYRVYGDDIGEPGVTVEGPEGARASLVEADRRYTLTVAQPEDTGALERACLRAAHVRLPENMAVYELTLKDASGIPLEILGRQTLTVVLPVPEALKGQELKLLTLDGNGQLEIVGVERVLADGVESFLFRTGRISLFGLIGVGEAQEEIMELDMDMVSFSAPPQGTVSPWVGVKLWAAGAVLTIGCLMVMPGKKAKKTH